MALFGFDKKYQRLKRSFEDSDFVFQTYSLWVGLTIIIFGVFAIRPLILLSIQKKDLISELKVTNTNLRGNIDQLEKLRQGVLTDTEAIGYLDVYMPPKFEVENYIEQLRGTVAEAGYYLKTVGVVEGENNTLIVSARLSGPGNFPKLIQDIENMRRLTTVVTTSYTLDTHSSVKGDSDVNLELAIYSMEGKR